MLKDGQIDVNTLINKFTDAITNGVKLPTDCKNDVAGLFDAALDEYVERVSVNNTDECLSNGKDLFPLAEKIYDDV